MLASIHPLGERVRHNRWSVTVTAYLLGSAAGGAAVGAVAGGIGRAMRVGSLMPRWSAAVVLAGAFVVELASRGRQLPGPRRQVNEDWLNRYRGWVYGAGFGFQLGAGVTTIITTAGVYAFVALAFLAASPSAGAVIGLTFGIVRALPVLALARARQPGDLHRVHRRLSRLAAPARHLGAA